MLSWEAVTARCEPRWVLGGEGAAPGKLRSKLVLSGSRRLKTLTWPLLGLSVPSGSTHLVAARETETLGYWEGFGW